MGIALLLFGLAFCSIPGPAMASEGPPPTLNPKTYASQSGKYSLFVNPSDLYGRGKASYRLTLDGREIWSAEKPYTLWEACVADDGVVGGYSYSHGWRGFSETGPQAGMGDFRVVILGARGKERLEKVAKREDSRFPHSPPNPLASGLILDVPNDRIMVRIRDEDVNRRSECWWIYRVSTGNDLSTFRPKELMTDSRTVRGVEDAKPVMGTPLMLLHWWRYDREKERKQGARFTLIGQDGKPVWSLELPADYDTAGDEKAEERLMESLRRTGGILGSDRPGRFELRFVKDKQRVTFVVARAAAGTWTVSEVERRPFVETTTPAPKPVDIPILSLRPVGRFDLKSPFSGPEPVVRDVNDFVFDERGRIAYIRWSGAQSLALVVVDQQGKAIHTVPLDPSSAENRPGWSGLTCVGADRYLMIRADPKDPNRMEGSMVDVTTGRSTPIPGFATTVLSKVAGFPDGGFVVKGGLAYFRGGATGDDSLSVIDSRGKRLWTLPGNGDPHDPAALFSPNDLTVTTDGMIAVVDVIRKSVQFFDRAGKHHHTVDMKKAWGREPNYPSDISADRDGGVVIQDFQGDPPIVRMKADGTVRSQVRPRLKDGRTFQLRDAQVAPDGVLWVCDGHALYRLLESGTAHRVLGESPDPRRLDEVGGVTLDGKGQIYAVVGRTGAVHVFAPDGRWLRDCVPATGDVPGELTLPHLTVSDSGDVYLGLGVLENDRSLHFSSDGRRVGIEASKLNEISEKWFTQPDTGRRWVLAYEKVYLIDGTGAVVRTIMRRADGFWLERPEDASVAADGSIAVVSSAKRSRDDGDIAITLYSPQGEPIRTVMLAPTVEWSFPRIAYDGKRLVAAGEKEIVLFDVSGKALRRFTPPQNEGAWWTPFLPPAGGLLLFDGRKTLYRFELP